VLRYGPGAEHIADLRLPQPGEQRQRSDLAAPMVIFLHGGFWRTAFDRAHTGPLAAALAAAGFVVCTPEYRRTGQAGGGWPGTFDDVAAAVDALPGLAAAATRGLVDPRRALLAGHSAGGHLALWAAGRHRLPPGARWRLGQASAAGVVGVVGLAAVCDLTACFEQDLGNGAAGELIGGSPARFLDRYAVADPARVLPIGVPVRLVHGTADDRVPCQMSRDYTALAQATGDDAACAILPQSGHFDVIDPLSAAWPDVVAAFRSPAFGAGAVGGLGQP
jgi:dipeptidyl aminopeptidase/acylaminoacyl peptidase